MYYMKKKTLLCVVLLFCVTGCRFDKSNPIIFEKAETDEYVFVIYKDKEYVPYSTCNPKDMTKYIGYVEDDQHDEIYTFKNYSKEEWIINYLNSGEMNSCMLMKEKDVVEIPDGLSSEYDWNHMKNNRDDYKNEEDNIMKVLINDKEYNIELEDNETVEYLISLLPIELKMKELNGNEKYYYFDKSLPSSAQRIGRIEKGDLMLYGDDCLVLFYKSFDTSYSYTKIGHIDNLFGLGDMDVEVKFVN